MSIIVKSIKEPFKVIIDSGEEKVSLTLKQLDYKTKAHITSLTTVIREGQVTIDSVLTCFYNVKYGVKDIKGVVDEEGNEYKLSFDTPQKIVLTDECVDELLATSFSDSLQFTARTLPEACFPSEIIHPLTMTKIEGIEVVSAKEMKGTSKK